ncbi:hypothetical protein LTR09_007695 [Extremus antarcticus]|uniref:Major facilitator superfamily (MFS) profile domain-containing protein n=1 Tax=Extremus antarcticus TaxID=702011 RepID=A0AAJ0DJ39_9PEZI|nr:hypothetical protein LTR09_007695 [Extremus antarcticus]
MSANTDQVKVESHPQDTDLTKVHSHTEGYDLTAIESTQVPPPSDTPPPPDGGFYGWLAVFGTCLVFFNTWGLVQAFGAYQSYYTTHLLSDYNASSIAWIGTLQAFLLVFGGVVTGPIFDQGYLRPLIMTGSVLIVLGMMMLSLARTYWQILLAQSICVGAGSGMLFTPSLAQVTILFSRRRPIALGMSMIGTGLGGILYPIVFRQLEPTLGFGWATRVIAFIALGTLSVAVVVLCWRKPAKKPPRSLFDWSAWKEPPFVTYTLSTFLTFTGYWVPWFFIPLYGQFAVGATATFSAYLLSITNAAGIVGRLTTPLIQRYLTPLQTLLIAHVLVVILIWAWLAIGSSFAGFVTFCVLWGLFSGPLAVLPAAAVAELSPSLNVVGTRMGMVWAVSAFGNLVGPPIAGAVSNPSEDDFLGGQIYAGVTMAMAIGLVGTTVVLLLSEKRRGKEGT